MQHIRHVMPSNFNLFLFGDTHIGSALCHKNGIEQLINTMNSTYADLGEHCNYGIFHGDAIEAIMLDDPRYHPSSTDGEPYPMVQAKDVVEIFQPIKHKLLVWLNGNHERKLWRFGHLAKEMAESLDVPYGTYTSILNYVDRHGKLLFNHFATHGRKSINSTADDPKRRKVNMELILKRHLKFKAGNVALMSKGHTHKILICRPESELYIYNDNRRIKQGYTDSDHTDIYIHPDHKWYINTGSFMKLYGIGFSGYAELAEYDPIELGYVVVLVRNRKIVDAKKEILN